jgi:lipid-A-disaccharide synthase-like uncharacterized protein
VTAIEYVGWFGNACFFARVALQWIGVERRKTRAAPRLFWLLSIAGSILLGAFAVQRGTWILLVGFAVNGLIYTRNLQIGSIAEGALPMTNRVVLSLALASALALVAAGLAGGPLASGGTWAWTALAIVGQATWSSRFVVQWAMSERSRQSHFPPAFWVISLIGNVLLLIYAVHLWEAVFIAGLALGPIAQVRNLWLTAGARGAAAPPREIPA